MINLNICASRLLAKDNNKHLTLVLIADDLAENDPTKSPTKIFSK